MLLGQFDGKLDAKNRIGFPKKFQKVLGSSLIITFGYENTLIVVSAKNWQALLEGTEGKPFIHQEARETQRFLLGGASDVVLDRKGRFILPAYLRKFAKIEDEVVFVGLSRYVEMWDKKRWEQYQGILEGRIHAIAKRLVEEKDK